MWMISMKAVLDIVSQYCPDDDGSCSKAGADLREMLDEIEGLEETEVVPVKRGHIELFTDAERYEVFKKFRRDFDGECSECGSLVFDTDKFCPECGAVLHNDQEGEG